MDSEDNGSSARISPIWRLLLRNARRRLHSLLPVLPRAPVALALAALCVFLLVVSGQVPAPPRHSETGVLQELNAPFSTVEPATPQPVAPSPTPGPPTLQPAAPSPTLESAAAQPGAASPALEPAAAQPGAPSPALEPAAAEPVTASSAPEPAAPEPVPPSPTPVPDISQLVTLINGYRAENGLGPLATSPALTQAAQWMSEDMAGNGYLSHTDSLGRGNLGRLAAFGYDCTAYNTWCGESLAAGTATAWETLDAWRNSPAHNALLLKADFVALGVGGAYNEGSTYRWYWVLELGGQAR